MINILIGIYSFATFVCIYHFIHKLTFISYVKKYLPELKDKLLPLNISDVIFTWVGCFIWISCAPIVWIPLLTYLLAQRGKIKLDFIKSCFYRSYIIYNNEVNDHFTAYANDLTELYEESAPIKLKTLFFLFGNFSVRKNNRSITTST